MTPKIIEIENGRLKLTPECWIIEELKDIIDKYQSVLFSSLKHITRY